MDCNLKKKWAKCIIFCLGKLAETLIMVNQSINELYLSTVVIKAKKLMGPWFILFGNSVDIFLLVFYKHLLSD